MTKDEKQLNLFLIAIFLLGKYAWDWYKTPSKIEKDILERLAFTEITEIEEGVPNKIAEKIASDIYKEIQEEILANKKFRKEMLKKVILELIKANKKLTEETIKTTKENSWKKRKSS